MSEEENDNKEKIPFKIISSDTSIKLPDELKKEDEAVEELLEILKTKVSAPRPISSKPLPIGAKKGKPVKFFPARSTQPSGEAKKPVETPPSKNLVANEESEIIIPDKIEGADVSEDILKMSTILKEIKEEEIADRIEEKKDFEIPTKFIIGINIKCPHCSRKILLDRLEYLKQGYSDYCPYCNLMILPDILPEDYKPAASTEKE